MYPNADFAEAEARLGSFLIFRFGGSQNYPEERGYPKLWIRHAPFAVNTKARDRWIPLMEAAIVECQIAGDAATVMSQL
jgi:hemoglobin